MAALARSIAAPARRGPQLRAEQGRHHIWLFPQRQKGLSHLPARPGQQRQYRQCSQEKGGAPPEQPKPLNPLTSHMDTSFLFRVLLSSYARYR